MINPENSERLEELLNDDVQFAYIRFFEKGNILQAEQLKNAGINPDCSNEKIQSVVHEAYLEFFNMGIGTSVKKLKEITGIEPIIDEEVVQEGYGNCFEMGYIPFAKAMEDFTGIKPREEIVQNGYLKCFENGESFRVEDLKKFTGIEPDYSREYIQDAIQEGYSKCFKKKWIDIAKKLEKMSGIEPSEEILEKYGVDWE